MLIGGGGEKKTLPIVAEHADIWHASGDQATLRRKIDVLETHCRAIGRDPDEIERCGLIVPCPAVPAEEAAGYATPDELRELGYTLFTWTIGGPNYDLEPLRQWIDWRDKHNG